MIRNRTNLYLLETRLVHLSNLRQQVQNHGLEEEYSPILGQIKSDLQRLLNVHYTTLGSSPFMRDPIAQLPDLPAMIIPHMISDFVEIVEREFGLHVLLPRRLEDEFDELITPTQPPPIPPVKKPRMCTRYIKKNASDEEDVCGICLDQHTQVESVQCSCSHFFGKDCFHQWSKTRETNQQEINCPTCRTTVTKITVFRFRERPTNTSVRSLAE